MVEFSFQGEEERVSRRIKTQFDFSYKVVSGGAASEKTRSARTEDISSNGLRFRSNSPVPKGSVLEVELSIPDHHDLIRVRGTVERIGFHHGKGYDIGIRFTSIAEKDKEHLYRKIDILDITKLLEVMMRNDASDLHLTVNKPPYLRINTELKALPLEPLGKDDLKRMIYSVMTEEQINQFEKKKELNYALQFKGMGRWRVNVHIQRGCVEATYREVRTRIRNREELGLPEVVDNLARFRDGLVIIAGPTGSGKSTTLASMIDLINHERKKVIVTIEDPIEFIHESAKCIVKQREVGFDTLSFSNALKNVLRQDPDVVLIGEVRDLETMSVALKAAETGHLVFTTLHTSDATQTINRILGIFPNEQRESAALQLSSCLRGVICQKILPTANMDGLVVATEVLTATPAVKTVIREEKIEQIPTLIQTGTKQKMHLMDASVMRLYEEKKINYETATSAIVNTRFIVPPH